jgi:integrase
METTDRIRVPGFGSLLRRGDAWYIRYSVNGTKHSESAKSPDQAIALKLLKQRTQEAGKDPHHHHPTAENKVIMRDLFDAVTVDYQNAKRRSTKTLGFILKHLRPYFDTMRAVKVTGDVVARYQHERLAAKAAPGTINRESAILGKAFTLAIENRKLSSKPKIRRLKEPEARQGFTTPETFAVIEANLPDDGLRDYCRFLYETATRKTGAALLEWKDVDRAAGLITFPREIEKNGKPRQIPMVGVIGEVIERRWAARTFSRYVFHRNGKVITNPRLSWSNATAAAGVPNLLLHDLRRSTVKNLIAAGVDQVTAMKVTGHRSVQVFQRYNIVTTDDVRRALEKTQANAAPKGKVIPMR